MIGTPASVMPVYYIMQSVQLYMNTFTLPCKQLKNKKQKIPNNKMHFSTGMVAGQDEG